MSYEELPRPHYRAKAVPCPHCGADYDYDDWERHRLHARTKKPRCLYRRPNNESHAQLVTLAARWLRKQRCSVVFAEPTVLHHVSSGSFGTYMPDAIGWRNICAIDTAPKKIGSMLVEAKTSLGDLKREAKKRCDAPGNHRWLLVPESLGDKAAALVPELFPGWGLLVARGRFLRELIPAPQHLELSPQAAELEQAILVTSLARHQKGVLWLGKEYRFETIQERDKRSRASYLAAVAPVLRALPVAGDVPSAPPSAVRKSSG